MFSFLFKLRISEGLVGSGELGNIALFSLDTPSHLKKEQAFSDERTVVAGGEMVASPS